MTPGSPAVKHEPRRFTWRGPTEEHELVLAWIPGTSGSPYGFGHGDRRRPMELAGFFMSTTPVTQALWPGVPVVPAMSTGATDSRFMRNAGIPMYGVTGMVLDPADARAHGLDERIEIQRLYDGREFLYRLVPRVEKREQ